MYTLEIKGPPNHFHLKSYLIIIPSVLHLHTYHISWSRRLISRSVASIYTHTPKGTWTAKTHGNSVFFKIISWKSIFLSMIRDDWYIFALYWCLCVSICLYILLLFYKTDSLTGLFPVNTLPIVKPKWVDLIVFLKANWFFRLPRGTSKIRRGWRQKPLCWTHENGKEVVALCAFARKISK